VRPSRPICPILDCATALSIVATLIAVIKMATMHRMTNRPELFVISPSTHINPAKAPQSRDATGAPGGVT
jgi:hypothetical protein